MSNLSSHLFKSWTIILEINAPMCFEIPIHWRDLCPHGETTPFQHALKYIQNTFQLLCALSFQSVEYYLRRIDILVIHRHDIWLSHQFSIQFFFLSSFLFIHFCSVFVCRSLGGIPNCGLNKWKIVPIDSIHNPQSNYHSRDRRTNANILKMHVNGVWIVSVFIDYHTKQSFFECFSLWLRWLWIKNKQMHKHQYFHLETDNLKSVPDWTLELGRSVLIIFQWYNNTNFQVMKPDDA